MLVTGGVGGVERSQVGDVGRPVVAGQRGRDHVSLAGGDVDDAADPASSRDRPSSPWLESIGYSAPPNAIMLYQVPFGSKSWGSGWATGQVRDQRLLAVPADLDDPVRDAGHAVGAARARQERV